MVYGGMECEGLEQIGSEEVSGYGVFLGTKDPITLALFFQEMWS